MFNPPLYLSVFLILGSCTGLKQSTAVKAVKAEEFVFQQIPYALEFNIEEPIGEKKSSIQLC